MIVKVQPPANEHTTGVCCMLGASMTAATSPSAHTVSVLETPLFTDLRVKTGASAVMGKGTPKVQLASASPLASISQRSASMPAKET